MVRRGRQILTDFFFGRGGEGEGGREEREADSHCLFFFGERGFTSQPCHNPLLPSVFVLPSQKLLTSFQLSVLSPFSSMIFSALPRPGLPDGLPPDCAL